MIDAWLQSDAEMSVLANEKRGVLTEGRVLSRIYIMDMIDEHLQIGGKTKEIDEFIRSSPTYVDLLKINFGGDTISSRYEQMVRSPHRHCLKNRFLGIALFLARRLAAVPLVRNYINNKRFPIPM